MFAVSDVLVLSEIVTLFRSHALCMHDMVLVIVKTIIFQWTGQFVCFTSDLTPEVLG